ncbi:hypothetical protein GS531_00290 [Rhodococcus hoagii]|nr:hypothetical protein [Prescottella equi]
MTPTRAGLMAAGYITEDSEGRSRPDLRVPRFTLSMAAHTLGVCDLAAGYWRRGFDVVSEREINRADARDRAKDNFLDPLRWAVFHTPGRSMPYAPDFVVTAPGSNSYRNENRPPNLDPYGEFVTRSGQRYGTAGGGVLTIAEQYPTLGDGSRPVAIELERTKKRRGEYEEIMAGYKSATHLAGVVYFASSKPIATALAAAATTVGLPADRYLINLHLPWLAMPDL